MGTCGLLRATGPLPTDLPSRCTSGSLQGDADNRLARECSARLLSADGWAGIVFDPEKLEQTPCSGGTHNAKRLEITSWSCSGALEAFFALTMVTTGLQEIKDHATALTASTGSASGHRDGPHVTTLNGDAALAARPCIGSHLARPSAHARSCGSTSTVTASTKLSCSRLPMPSSNRLRNTRGLDRPAFCADAKLYQADRTHIVACGRGKKARCRAVSAREGWADTYLRKPGGLV